MGHPHMQVTAAARQNGEWLRPESTLESSPWSKVSLKFQARTDLLASGLLSPRSILHFCRRPTESLGFRYQLPAWEKMNGFSVWPTSALALGCTGRSRLLKSSWVIRLTPTGNPP